MPGSIRPWVTAGVAVVGAAVIAVAPFEPLPRGDEIHIANSAVEITATPSPLQFYPQVVMRSLTNAGDLIEEYFSDPMPIVTAVTENQYLALADIVDAARSSDAVAVVTAVLRAIAIPVVNLVKVAGRGEPFRTAASLIVRLALPVVSGVLAAGSAVGDVVDALLQFDFPNTVSAVTNLPARIVDGVLNGRVDAASGEQIGLLTPVLDAPVADQLTGPVAFLINSLHDIGDTISAPSPAAAGAGPIETIAPGAAAQTPDAPSPSEPPPSSSGPSDDPPPAAQPPQDPPTGSGVDPEQNEPPDDSPPEDGEATHDGADATDPDTGPAVRSEDSAVPRDERTPQDSTDEGSSSDDNAPDDDTDSGQ